MTRSVVRIAVLALFHLAISIPAPAAPQEEVPARDPLAAEIARWSERLHSQTSDDELWKQIRQGPAIVLGRAEQALKDGRRLLALQRLGVGRMDVAAAFWTEARPEPERTDERAFEAAWTRLGEERAQDFRLPAPAAFEGVRPALVRGLGEAAAAQAGTLYRASLDYGRSTEPLYGLFYAGAAEAQLEFASFCRSLSDPASPRGPALRSFAPELEALEEQILKSYKPPASVDRHGEFITASAALKEARELDAAGLRYGALVKLLDATMRAGLLRAPGPDDASTTAPSIDSLRQMLAPFEKKLAARGRDHTIGRAYLEAAQANLPGATDARPAVALSIARDVLPRYLQALEPAAPRRPRPQPIVTVTLVRWPYT
jgi:hypothetical protein